MIKKTDFYGAILTLITFIVILAIHCKADRFLIICILFVELIYAIAFFKAIYGKSTEN
jgi:hypothetical protein